MLVVPHAFSLAVYENFVYFTDWSRLGIMRVEKFGDEQSELLYNNSQGNLFPMGLAAYHRSLQPTGLYIFNKSTSGCHTVIRFAIYKNTIMYYV